ncbi:MAG TPA: hypothetical protein V6C81_11905 [Planktothrix sp.]|jgi:hypothetical protein
MLAFICILAAIAGGAIGTFFAMFAKKEQTNSRKLAAFFASWIISGLIAGIIGQLNGNLGLPVALGVPADLLLFVIILS